MKGDQWQSNNKTSQSVQFCCLCRLTYQPASTVQTEAHCLGYAVGFHPGMNVLFFFSSNSALQFYVLEAAALPKGVLTKICVCLCLCVYHHVCLGVSVCLYV